MKTAWLSERQQTFYPPLSENLRADVCVIGGGITGVTTAYMLQQAGRRVILVEANKIGTGVTGYTSGHLTSLVDVFYHKISSKLSERRASVVMQATKEARSSIEKMIADNALICDYKKVPGYYYATNEQQLEILTRERKALIDLGETVHSPGLENIPVKCKDAIMINNQAVIDANAFAKGLAKSFADKGGHIYEQSRVTKLEQNGEFVRLHFEDDHMIEARDVVQATHTPIGISHLQMELKNYNSYVLYGESSKEVLNGLYYDLADPYHYIRHFEENGRPMYIVGGCDTKTGEGESEQKALDNLLEYASTQLSITKTRGSWSSILFTSPDGLPLIGSDPERPNCYLATGFAGDGLTFSIVSALINTALITEGTHPWQDVFSPKRISTSTVSTVIKKGMKTLKHMVAEKFTTKADSDKEFPRNSGKVLKVDGEPAALYKDENGEISGVSGLCTHMQCMLHFNDVAKTWDCGCHGSRYSLSGKVLAGPATENLKQLRIDHEVKH